MKKYILLVSLILSVLLVFIFSRTASIEPENLNNKKFDSTFIIFEKKNCSDCKELNKLLEEQTDSKLRYKKIYLDSKKSVSKWGEFIKHNNIHEVPSVFYIKDGKINKLEGEGNPDKLIVNMKNRLN